MNLLLDTHIALWAILIDELLPQKAKDLILNTANEIYYSSISTWEVLLKHSSDPKNLYISVTRNCSERSTWGLASCAAQPARACLSPCASLRVLNSYCNAIYRALPVFRIYLYKSFR